MVFMYIFFITINELTYTFLFFVNKLIRIVITLNKIESSLKTKFVVRFERILNFKFFK